jgi:cytochrome c-type biogenesis protein CcmI
MPLVIAVLLGLAALLIVAYPLLGLDAAGASAKDAALAEVSEQESSARQALRDVDFDHRLGNLDDADYGALREDLEERALAAMKARYAHERALDTHIERQLAALRADRRPSSAPAKAAQTATHPRRSAENAAETADAPSRGPFPSRRDSGDPNWGPGKGLGSRRRGA